MSSPSIVCCLAERENVEQNLDELIRNQFILENYGVNGINEELKDEDKHCLKLLQNSMEKIGNHYEISLSWKNKNEKPPDTLPMAIKRLEFLERKFIQDPDLKEAYTVQIQKLFDRGYARQISFEQIKYRKNVWTLPHFAVKNPKKPNKSCL